MDTNHNDHSDPRRGPRGLVYGMIFSLCIWTILITIALILTH